jgi:hypothetical protein
LPAALFETVLSNVYNCSSSSSHWPTWR